MKKVLVLGATGSIGTSALDIIRARRDEFSLAGICANSSGDSLLKIQREFSLSESQVALFSQTGREGLRSLAERSQADIAVNGISGAAGLFASQAVLNAGIDLALANKETVVMAGGLVKSLAAKNGAKILPVDSEHSAIFDLCQKCGRENVDQITITASGGPFRLFSKKELEKVSVSDALNHPTWKMGKKITVDSATLANKGLEVIEASLLFDIPPEKIRVAIHPQSLVHSLVRTRDGTFYAQISQPDMKAPIFRALSFPEILPSPAEPFDLIGAGKFEFCEPRWEDFPMLSLAYRALEKGGALSIAFNAANEVAVDAFLREKIGFLQIAEIVGQVMSKNWSDAPRDFEDVERLDGEARKSANSLL